MSYCVKDANYATRPWDRYITLPDRKDFQNRYKCLKSAQNALSDIQINVITLTINLKILRYVFNSSVPRNFCSKRTISQINVNIESLISSVESLNSKIDHMHKVVKGLHSVQILATEGTASRAGWEITSRCADITALGSLATNNQSLKRATRLLKVVSNLSGLCFNKSAAKVITESRNMLFLKDSDLEAIYVPPWNGSNELERNLSQKQIAQLITPEYQEKAKNGQVAVRVVTRLFNHNLSVKCNGICRAILFSAIQLIDVGGALSKDISTIPLLSPISDNIKSCGLAAEQMAIMLFDLQTVIAEVASINVVSVYKIGEGSGSIAATDE